MLLVLAHALDEEVTASVSRWSTQTCAVLRPADFARPGWILADDARRCAIVCGDRRVRGSDIHGVINCLSTVLPAELFPIQEPDRPYVAAELAALLTYLLNILPVRTINRPSAASLQGPSWRPERWQLELSRLGVRPASMTHEHTGPGLSRCATPTSATWLIDEPVEGTHPQARTIVQRLAEKAGVDYLELTLDVSDDAPRLLGFSLTPALHRVAVRDKLARVYDLEPA